MGPAMGVIGGRFRWKQGLGLSGGGGGQPRAAGETDPKGVKCHACHPRREKGRKHPRSTPCAPGPVHTLSSSIRITRLGAGMW